MTPQIDHIYECTWVKGEASFINLVTSISEVSVAGKCLSKKLQGFSHPLQLWSSAQSTVVLLGHKDEFPELLL